MREHVVITGTGRCGTTFLVQLLTRLGLETGFETTGIETAICPTAHAGLEHDLRRANCPFIVKWPAFCDFADEVITRGDISIRQIFVPVRELTAAAESRRHVHRSNLERLSSLRKMLFWVRPRIVPGGLWRTTSDEAGRQEEVLLGQLYKLMLAVSNTSVPVTFMRFPRIVQDGPYLFEKLQPLLEEISYNDFFSAFEQTVRPELVHRFTLADH